MKTHIEVGNVVEITIEGIKKQSKVFGFTSDGLFALVDYYYGARMIHQRNGMILIREISLIAKSKSPSLSDEEVKLFLEEIRLNRSA